MKKQKQSIKQDEKKTNSLKARRSQTRKLPSSLPEARRKFWRRFQLMTLTSWACARSQTHTTLLTTAAAPAVPGTRASQMRMLQSLLHDAKIVASDGDHCRSSTLARWPTNGPCGVTADCPRPAARSHPCHR